MTKPTKEQRERLKNVAKRPYLLGYDLTDALVCLVAYTEELEQKNERLTATPKLTDKQREHLIAMAEDLEDSHPDKAGRETGAAVFVLLAENERFDKALEFYADEGNWTFMVGYDANDMKQVVLVPNEKKAGDIARAALNPQTETPHPATGRRAGETISGAVGPDSTATQKEQESETQERV